MSIKRSIQALVVVVAFLSSPHTPDAQSSARKRLEAAKSLSCVFPTYATGTWNNDGPRAAVKATKLSLRVEGIDTQDGTAQIVGILGPSYAVARQSDGTAPPLTRVQ